MRIALLLCSALVLSACATTAPVAPSSSRLAQLTEDCTRRGGMLRLSSQPGGPTGGYICGGAPGRQNGYNEFREVAR